MVLILGLTGVRALARDKFRLLPWTPVVDLIRRQRLPPWYPGAFDAGIQRKNPHSRFRRD